jgi:predicted nucleic acid-binding protein
MSAVATLFLDTNVLVYARDRSELIKGPRAQDLLGKIFQKGSPLISVQVLSEFFWTVTRKLPVPLTPSEAIAEARRLIVLSRVAHLTTDLFEKAIMLTTAHQIPLWDAQIVAAASLGNASIILSEDFQHRQVLDGITFLNPFEPDFKDEEVLGP